MKVLRRGLVGVIVQRHGDVIARRLSLVFFAFELIGLGLVLWSLGAALPAVMLIIYILLEIFRHRTLGIATVVAFPDQRVLDSGRRYELALHNYYQVYLPLSVLPGVASSELWSALLGVALFSMFSAAAAREECARFYEAVIRYYYPLRPVIARRSPASQKGGGGMLPNGAPARAAVQEAIARGLEFLQRSQRQSGAFAVYWSSDPALEENCVDDASLFVTALIAYTLGFSSSPTARQIVERAVELFTREMEGSGIWRYWTREDPHYPNIPPDLDDIACISLVLKRHGSPFPDNRALILANRSRAGLFYTWLAPRLRPVVSRDFWTIALRQLLRPIPFFLFWIVFPPRPRDIDAVVNANVIFYLGENPAARPVVDFLTDTLKRGEEARSDKWHRSRFMFYYAVSRNWGSGICGLDEARDLIVDRVVAALRGDRGELRVLDRALAACALMNCRADPPELARAVAAVTATQHANGAWPALPLYWGGRAGSPGYGSEELTTGFCLEALVRYSATLPSSIEVAHGAI